ncbi:serine/threonine-protein phosphatase 6 regulatory subunit 3-like isoform X2 [Amphibalanus amphitrite]|uniref:serine/threonine-protein phosphatase 6 regulatory subunit 3-like isoform X2 n=1 Tax=Amphibalanus amphitrite TaxID=1232801 RepID=UPI001C91F251|nr:serine/threonine-protein phosphatase 6 regulatory subunit 3-like isoform X2 [Amphibalanus amphitrite]
MYWKFHAAPSARVAELLNKEDVTLEELLDEEDIIQECKAQNSNVIDFLVQPEVMMALVSHMVTEPDPTGDVASQYRYANMASEIVTCNVPAIIDQLAGERPLLRRLYSLLECEPPLNPLLASYFSRTLALLIVRRPGQSWYSYQFNCLQVLEFLKSMDTFIDLVLRHLGTSAIMDLTCNLISGIEAPEYRQNALNWLNDQRLVQRLAELMADGEHPDRQANAGQVIMSVVSCARQMAQQLGPGEKEPNPLVSTIETTEFVSSVLDGVLGPARTEAGLVNAFLVLRLLLDTGRPGAPYAQNEADEEVPPEEPASVQAVADALLPRLADCHRLLLEPPPRPAVPTTCGRLEPPLGATRLQVARLTTALLAANRHPVNCRLAQLGTIDLLLDLFFQYTLNNFLHSQVEQSIALILEAEPQESEEGKSCHPLLVHIFTKTKLVQRILQGMEEPQTNGESSEQKRRCFRSSRAYCGHLVNMANKVCSAAEEGPNVQLVREQLDALPDDIRASWQAFKEAKLHRINEQNKPVLPETKQETASESDYRQVTEAQQATILRLLHASTAGADGQGADDLGDDDGYNDIGDGLSASPDEVTPVGLLSLDAGGDGRPSAVDLFAAASEADPWPARRTASLEPCHSSSDEDDESDEGGAGDDSAPAHISMEVDTSDPWAAATATDSPQVAMETNMWEEAPPAAAPAAGDAAETAQWPAFQSQSDAVTAAPQSTESSAGTGSTTEQPSAFHANFEAAFSNTCAVQEDGQVSSDAPAPPGRPESLQLSAGAGSMEVQPELLVAEPVTPPADRPESPHELNSTGGDFTPLFHESSVTAESAAATSEAGDGSGESPLSEPTEQLADNYSFLTSQGLMNGSASEGEEGGEPEPTAELAAASRTADLPSPSKVAAAEPAAPQSEPHVPA